MTDIQRMGLPLALQRKDILGAAKTGSGKTLAFLIPVLEILHRNKWTQLDGLGALIISPTRELAMQIFDVLRKIGSLHSFSAGLIIGGKNVKDEQERLNRMNILVATPGRLLQHMDQTAGFTCDNLQVLVLDEADRILDLGFSKTINAIVENLPKERQTLLFSATQTKSVKDLARLSLSDPEYVSVHEQSTPTNLQQHYLVTELPDKLDVLYSFIKTHLHSKAIAFFSSCKQVRFVYETFRHLSPGVPLLHLHGKQKQTLRMDITSRFSTMKHAFLFATDIAARGLDFPAVDWVIQVDAPEDADTYIHRVGRTARFDRAGRALAFVLPSEEEGLLAEWERKKIPIVKIDMRKDKRQSVRQALQGLCFKDPEIKYLGQKAFMSYMRSVYLQRNKKIFDVNALPADEFAEALGLPGAPKIKFAKGQKNVSRQLEAVEGKGKKVQSKDNDDTTETVLDQPEKVKEEVKRTRTKYDKMFERKNQGVLAEHYDKLVEKEDEEPEDFITLKRADHTLDADIPEFSELSKRKQAIATSKAKSAKSKSLNNEKLVFDDEGNAHPLYELEGEEAFHAAGDAKEQKAMFFNAELGRMQEVDIEDKATAKEKQRAKKRERKAREREDDEGEKRGTGTGTAYLDNGEEEINPWADASEESEEEEDDDDDDDEPPPRKKQVLEKSPHRKQVLEVSQPQTLEDQEALALRLLGGIS